MCDVFVAVGEATVDGSVIFGKNSDRQPNEPQELLRIEGGTTNADTVKCTYIEVPQVETINTIFLSKPSWIWGAEMGINDKGVVIGNEAVWTIFTKDNPKESLIGMDFVRLALERGNTAREALDIIVDLLARYGQGGNCGYDQKEFYDNSYIIADKNEAYVLETAGKYWIAEKVQSIRTISNTLTIEQNYDLIHPELLDYAISTGRCKNKEDFNFKKQFEDKFNIIRIGARGDTRRACTLDILEKETGKVSPRTAFSALRAHNKDGQYNPRSSSTKSPCLHASSIITPTQTTASWVTHFGTSTVSWVTGTSAPCISVFKPVVIEKNGYAFEPLGETYEKGKLWWDFEVFHRKVLRNYPFNTALFDADRIAFENSLLEEVYDETYSVIENVTEVSAKSFRDGQQRLEEWTRIVNEKGKNGKWNLRYNLFWNRLNKKSKLSEQMSFSN